MKNLLIISLLFIFSFPAWTQVSTRKFTRCLAHTHNKTKILILDFYKKDEGFYIHFNNYGLSYKDPQMLINDPDNWREAAGLFKCEFSLTEINCSGLNQGEKFKLAKTGQNTAQIDFQMSNRSVVGLEMDNSGRPENCSLF